jgi:GNAT superfamily N-acetyltransferase
VDYYFADETDLDLLADWNHQLIRDEDHRNPMTIPELRERMRRWLDGMYETVVFEIDGEPVAYALYCQNPDDVYLRHFFVRRDRRRQGIGRAAFGLLRDRIWPRDRRLLVEALTANAPALAFWRAMGYRDYCLTLEIMPEQSGDAA